MNNYPPNMDFTKVEPVYCEDCGKEFCECEVSDVLLKEVEFEEKNWNYTKTK